MQTRDEKLDLILERLGEMRTDLQVHIAVDEGMWRRVAEAEDELKDVVKDANKLKTKHAALAATIAASVSTLTALAQGAL